MDQQAEKGKTERETGLGRRTREGIAKWNQMTALRFQSRGETSDIPGLPSGEIKGRSREEGKERVSESVCVCVCVGATDVTVRRSVDVYFCRV